MWEDTVLILVVVEDGLRVYRQKPVAPEERERPVLILVVVEDGLRVEPIQINVNVKLDGLNPCCGGRWSQSIPRWLGEEEYQMS